LAFKKEKAAGDFGAIENVFVPLAVVFEKIHSACQQFTGCTKKNQEQYRNRP
jgi:hypothetical protein